MTEIPMPTGATMLNITGEIAAALGCPILRKTHVRVADGRSFEVTVVKGVSLELPELRRSMTTDAMVQPNGKHVLIGQIPLEEMDLVVDPRSRELRPNPESPDTPTLDSVGVTLLDEHGRDVEV